MFKILSEGEGGKGVLVGPTIPGLDGLEEVLNYGGGFTNLVAGLYSLDINKILGELGNVVNTGLAIPLSKASPELRTILSYMFGSEVRDDGSVRPLTNRLDPKFTFWLQQHPVIWTAFTKFVPVELEKDIKPGPTYYGLQYKVRDGYEKRWMLFQQALLFAGLNRFARDYAEIVQPVFERGGLPTDVKASFSTDANSGLEWFGRASGIVSPAQTMSQSERELKIIEDQTRRMRALGGQ
jgi:hypothetical protein